ncbi:MAG: tetratricopeptide repeat protein [Candidatus Micrarchaeia archaeon]
MLSERAYAKQVLTYVNSRNYADALRLALEMAKNYPSSFLSAFILSKAYFWNDMYDDAESHATKAVSYAKNENDRNRARFFLSLVYIQKDDLRKAYEILDQIPKSSLDPYYWELKVILDLALDRGSEDDFKRLYLLNREMAEKLLIEIMVRYKV